MCLFSFFVFNQHRLPVHPIAIHVIKHYSVRMSFCILFIVLGICYMTLHPDFSSMHTISFSDSLSRENAFDLNLHAIRWNAFEQGAVFTFPYIFCVRFSPKLLRWNFGGYGKSFCSPSFSCCWYFRHSTTESFTLLFCTCWRRRAFPAAEMYKKTSIECSFAYTHIDRSTTLGCDSVCSIKHQQQKRNLLNKMQ